jgi:hypothetical protein
MQYPKVVINEAKMAQARQDKESMMEAIQELFEHFKEIVADNANMKLYRGQIADDLVTLIRHGDLTIPAKVTPVTPPQEMKPAPVKESTQAIPPAPVEKATPQPETKTTTTETK